MAITTIKISSCRYTIWNETKKYLAHYRSKSEGDLEIYNAYAIPLIEMFRGFEFRIEHGEILMKRQEYREKIKEMEEKIKEKLEKGI